MDLTREEHQELVLMLGSRKEWATYLGLSPEQATSIWTNFKLLVPTAYVKGLQKSELFFIIADRRGVKQAAAHLNVSEAFLVGELRSRAHWRNNALPSWDAATCRSIFERYRSVRFVARMLGKTESQVRKNVAAAGVEIASLIDYSTGDHSNAKGRRAELDFALMRGSSILQDLNLCEGSQAKYDFDDAGLGRVNVKSACRQKYKAKTRKEDPYFWKWSTRGAKECDCFAILCYDEGMQNLIGYRIVQTARRTFKKSEILQKGNLILPKE